MQRVGTGSEISVISDSWMKSGFTIGFVPTMGALHDGHLALVDKAKMACNKVVVSIFVNPTQFGPQEDFDKYPRTLERDAELLAERGVDVVFLPTASGMYPEGFQTYVHNPVSSDILCGKSRPGHFQGVLTVVLKLLNLVKPTKAFFGLKDYQQFALIKLMARDLALGVDILGVPTVRESDGLAMSSRNVNLSSQERQLAPVLFRGLKRVRESFHNGETSPKKLREEFLDTIGAVPELALDYFEIRDKISLFPFDEKGAVQASGIAFCAAKLGSVRLIDNLELESQFVE